MTKSVLETIEDEVIDSFPKTNGMIYPALRRSYLGATNGRVNRLVNEHTNPIDILVAHPDLVPRNIIDNMVEQALLHKMFALAEAEHAKQFDGKQYEILTDIIDDIGRILGTQGEIATFLHDFAEDPSTSDILSIVTDLRIVMHDLRKVANRNATNLADRIEDIANIINKNPNQFYSDLMEQFNEHNVSSPRL